MQKIAFLGLDNAGKTSILIALKRKYNFQEEVEGLKPTIQVQRTSFKFLNIEIHQHDFGGQEKYREEYLNHKDRFLGGTDLIYYIIDVQDSKRFKDSLEYFSSIAGYFKEHDIKLPIVVMLHKFDPKLKTVKEIVHGIMDLKKELNEWLPHHNIYFFETSIYDLYTLVDAFSFGIAQIFGKKELIDNYIASIGEKFNTIAFLLFDENGLSISEYYRTHLVEEERAKIRGIFGNIQRRISDNSCNIFEFSDWISYDKRISGAIQCFSVGYIKFYVLIIIDETSEEEAVQLLDRFESYKDDLNEILQGLISSSSLTI